MKELNVTEQQDIRGGLFLFGLAVGAVYGGVTYGLRHLSSS